MKYTFLFNEIFRTAIVELVKVCPALVKVCSALVESVYVHVRPGLVEHCQTVKWPPKRNTSLPTASKASASFTFYLVCVTSKRLWMKIRGINVNYLALND